MRKWTLSLVIFALLSAAAAAPQSFPGSGGSIGAPISVATDAIGNVYFASSNLNVVFKLDPNGVLARVAGNSRLGYSGRGGPATSVQLRLVFGDSSAVSAGPAGDSAGNLFIADTSNHRNRRVSPDGIITRVAGKGG